MSDRKPSKEDKQAIKEFMDAHSAAKKEMDEFESVQSFAMASEATDINGELTRVLIVDTDREGVIGEYMENGSPFELTEKGVSDPDKKLISHYLRFMSNVDLSDPEVQKAVGWSAIGKAREMVAGFFMLRLVSELNVAEVTVD